MLRMGGLLHLPEMAPDEHMAFLTVTPMHPSRPRLIPRGLPLNGHIRKHPSRNTPPSQIPNPLPFEVNMAIAVTGGVVCHVWCDKKVGGE